MADSAWKALVSDAIDEQSARHDDQIDAGLSRAVTQELTGTEPEPPTADLETAAHKQYARRLHQQIDDLERRRAEASSMRPGLLDRLVGFIRGSRAR